MEKKPKVMLLEDDLIMLSLLKTLLAMDGFDVLHVDEKSDDVLEAIRLLKPDVMLMDVHLTYLNGLDLLRKIRHENDIRNTVVIMSSGMNVEKECSEAGANSFLLKPYMPDDLLSAIRKHLPENST